MGSFYRPAASSSQMRAAASSTPPTLEIVLLPDCTNVPAYPLPHASTTSDALLLSHNVNLKIVSEMLGHASVAITLDTYSHALPTMQESVIRALEGALK